MNFRGPKYHTDRQLLGKNFKSKLLCQKNVQFKSSDKVTLTKLERFVTKNLNLSGKLVLKHRPVYMALVRTLRAWVPVL